jgi:hypothetical protein
MANINAKIFGGFLHANKFYIQQRKERENDTLGAIQAIELKDSQLVEVHAVSPILIRWVMSTDAIPAPITVTPNPIESPTEVGWIKFI